MTRSVPSRKADAFALHTAAMVPVLAALSG
jgi:hypothetical protein